MSQAIRTNATAAPSPDDHAYQVARRRLANRIAFARTTLDAAQRRVDELLAELERLDRGERSDATS